MSVHGKFPTRDGVATGSANERAMLEKVGYDGIRTELREDANGLVTMLRTRGGHPEFSNKPVDPPAVSEPIKCAGPYGFVDTTFNTNAIGDAASGTLQYLVDELGLIESAEKTKIKDTHAWKELFHNNLPSNYSGLMRRLMQVEHSAVPVGERNGFSCEFSRSHGLFVNQANSKRWLIEIDDTGVYRIPLTFCKDIDSTWAEYVAYENWVFANYSREQANKTLSPYWRVKKIKKVERARIGDSPACYADGYGPFYSWCGWAFNYLGTAATISVVRGHPSEPSWYQAALFDLSITGAGDDGVPTYAVCTASSVSVLAHNINDYGDNENAFIQAAFDMPGKLATISLHSPISIAAQSVHAPIFSYYTESNEKRVYYFDAYKGSTKNSTDSKADSQTITISRTGSWVCGNFATGVTFDYPPDGEISVPYSYDITVKSISSGIVSENYNGTQGGWGGFSGPGLADQNSDYSGSYSNFGRTTGPSGFASPGGYSGFHVSRLSYVGVGAIAGQVYDRADLLPYRDQLYALSMPVITVIEYSTTSHYRSDSHQSTILLHGYDRESIAFAHSKTLFESAHVKSGTYPSSGGLIVPSGSLLGARHGSAMNIWGGGEDWGLYAPIDGQYGLDGGFAISHITGYYDWSAFSGVVASAAGRVTANMTNPAGFEGESLGVPAIYEEVPEKTTTTRTLKVFVGPYAFNETITHGDFHQTYFNGDFFRFWAGKSGVGQACFYSKDISKKPAVVGVGQYVATQRSLFGFIGVF